MTTTRTASTSWAGGLADGKGTVSLQSSGVGSFDVSWPSRAEEPDGKTSPEELIAAAHSSCFSMALGAQLGGAGLTPESIETEAAVTLAKVGEGFSITKIALTTKYRWGGSSATTSPDRAARIGGEAAATPCSMKGRMRVSGPLRSSPSGSE